MFSQACVKNSVHRGGVHGGGCAWQWACVAGVGMAGGHAWQGMCVVGGVAGICMVGGVHDRGCAWQGACVAGETATAADGMHPTGMHLLYTLAYDSIRQLLEGVKCCMPAYASVFPT